MCRIILCIYFSLFSISSFAWWDKEHQIVAIIAEKNLSHVAKQQVNILLNDDNLSDVANWADTIKSQSKWSHSKSWHYMNIDKNQNFASYKTIVGGDILWALNYFYQQLKKTDNPLKKRREALMFFIHLVGDIHQPLHVGKASDKGGNRVPVIWKNQSRITNLHKVWDGLLTQTDLSPAKVSRKIDNSSSSDRAVWQDASFQSWVKESSDLIENIYDFGDKNKGKKIINLGIQYQLINRPIAEKRMLQAGVRLAHYLNLAFEVKPPVTRAP